MLERPISRAGWTRVRFDQIATQINDRVDNPAEAGVERYVGLEHLDPDSLRIRRWGEPTDVESTKLRFQPGDIIFGKRRVYQRKVAVADFEGICSAHAMVLRAKPGAVLPDFLPFFMQSDLFMERALSISVGSLSPTINWKALAAEEFLLPPIQEQARLVEGMSAATEAIYRFDEAISKFEPIIQSIFAGVIEGNESLIPLDLVSCLNIEKWTPKNLGDLCDLGSGHGFRPKDWSSNGLPIIRIQNVRGSRDFNFYDGPFDKRWLVEAGELLFAWAGVPGVSFGPGIWPGPTAVLNQHIYRVTPRPGVDRDWLYEILLYLTPRIERRAHGFKDSLLHIKKIEFTSQTVRVPPHREQLFVAEWMRQQRQMQAALQSRLAATRQILSGLLNLVDGSNGI